MPPILNTTDVPPMDALDTHTGAVEIQFEIQLSPSAFFRSIPPTAAQPYPVLWGVSSPSGRSAAPARAPDRSDYAILAKGGRMANKLTMPSTVLVDRNRLC